MEKMNDLRDLLKHEIEDLQSVEDQILEALPKMIDKANNPDLKKALSEHLRVTEQHKSRLQKVMKEVEPKGEQANGKKKGILGGIFGGGKHVCKGMKGIIEEGEKIMNSDISPEALDAAIIASAQKVEHYEICGYGTARTFARELGMEQVARQLEQTLNEEYAADNLLTSLAVMSINEEAETPDGMASASSRGRSAGRAKEKPNREMEMEPVGTSRSRTTGKTEHAGTSKANSGNQNRSQSKPSGSPRTENGRGTGSSKGSATNASASKTTGRTNGRSASTGRSGSSKTGSRGRK